MRSPRRVLRLMGAVGLLVVGASLVLIALLALAKADYVAAKVSVAAIRNGSVFHVEIFQVNWSWMYWSLLLASIFVVVSGALMAIDNTAGALAGLALALAVASVPRVVDYFWQGVFRIWHWDSTWIDLILLTMSLGLFVVVWVRLRCAR